VLKDIEASISLVRDLRDPRITAWPVVLGFGVCSEELIRGAFALATSSECGFAMMFAATRPEYVGGETLSLAELARWGVLGRRTKLVHAVYLTPRDVDLLASAGCAVVFCPSAAMRHEKGIGRHGLHPEMLEAGVPVALGSDSANASNHADLMRVMWTAANLYKDARLDVRLIPAETALEMATLHGARALGLESQLGSIEVGKQADLVVHSTDDPAWHPMLNVVNNVVYSASSRTVRSVYVAGQCIYDDGQHRKMDGRRVEAAVEPRARRIIEELGMRVEQRWPLVD
jgi:cytosine/adenosine deaminase-related metal-dependent hydrolase